MLNDFASFGWVTIGEGDDAHHVFLPDNGGSSSDSGDSKGGKGSSSTTTKSDSSQPEKIFSDPHQSDFSGWKSATVSPNYYQGKSVKGDVKGDFAVVEDKEVEGYRVHHVPSGELEATFDTKDAAKYYASRAQKVLEKANATGVTTAKEYHKAMYSGGNALDAVKSKAVEVGENVTDKTAKIDDKESSGWTKGKSSSSDEKSDSGKTSSAPAPSKSDSKGFKSNTVAIQQNNGSKKLTDGEVKGSLAVVQNGNGYTVHHIETGETVSEPFEEKSQAYCAASNFNKILDSSTKTGNAKADLNNASLSNLDQWHAIQKQAYQMGSNAAHEPTKEDFSGWKQQTASLAMRDGSKTTLPAHVKDDMAVIKQNGGYTIAHLPSGLTVNYMPRFRTKLARRLF